MHGKIEDDDKLMRREVQLALQKKNEVRNDLVAPCHRLAPPLKDIRILFHPFVTFS